MLTHEQLGAASYRLGHSSIRNHLFDDRWLVDDCPHRSFTRNLSFHGYTCWLYHGS